MLKPLSFTVLLLTTACVVVPNEPEGYTVPGNIQVINATYGANCGIPLDHTMTLSQECNGREECSYPLDAAAFLDPVSNCSKTHVVTWRCNNSSAVFSTTASVNHTVITLSCPETVVLMPPPAGGYADHDRHHHQNKVIGNVIAFLLEDDDDDAVPTTPSAEALQPLPGNGASGSLREFLNKQSK